jgi:hypothetical protein
MRTDLSVRYNDHLAAKESGKLTRYRSVNYKKIKVGKLSGNFFKRAYPKAKIQRLKLKEADKLSPF